MTNQPDHWTVADYDAEQCEVVSDGVVHVAFCNNTPKGRGQARLIAAAPDLLEALKKTLCYLEADSDDDTEQADHAEARAAITKATP